jgi:hypothetical protein
MVTQFQHTPYLSPTCVKSHGCGDAGEVVHRSRILTIHLLVAGPGQLQQSSALGAIIIKIHPLRMLVADSLQNSGRTTGSELGWVSRIVTTRPNNGEKRGALQLVYAGAFLCHVNRPIISVKHKGRCSTAAACIHNIGQQHLGLAAP